MLVSPACDVSQLADSDGDTSVMVHGLFQCESTRKRDALFVDRDIRRGTLRTRSLDSDSSEQLPMRMLESLSPREKLREYAHGLQDLGIEDKCPPTDSRAGQH